MSSFKANKTSSNASLDEAFPGSLWNSNEAVTGSVLLWAPTPLCTCLHSLPQLPTRILPCGSLLPTYDPWVPSTPLCSDGRRSYPVCDAHPGLCGQKHLASGGMKYMVCVIDNHSPVSEAVGLKEALKLGGVHRSL